MTLRRFTVENYRCFRDRQELEIRPVTVVFGRNNAGKSALVRAPLIFSTGFGASTTAPLDIESFEDLGLSMIDEFPDLIYGRSEHGKINLGVEVDGAEGFQLEASLQYIDEFSEAITAWLRIQDATRTVELDWIAALLFGGGSLPYEISEGQQNAVTHSVEFRGLLPTIQSVPGLRGWLAKERSLGVIRFLSSYREPSGRHHRLPLGTPKALDHKGQGAAQLLAHDRVRGRGELISIINHNLRDLLPGWEIDEHAVGPLWSTVLKRPGGESAAVNLADGGTGLAQVLPLLVQCALDQQAGTGAEPALQIIEEPEMHLHPAAHMGLADIFLRTADKAGTRFLIETHSESLLLRLRRRIAEGSYAPDMIGIYVVEQEDGVSTVRRVDVDDLGNLGEEWPEGYFSQDYNEVKALAAAQLRRNARAA